MQAPTLDFTTEIRRLTAEFEELVAIASDQLNELELHTAELITMVRYPRQL
jgi:hypothetical protein